MICCGYFVWLVFPWLKPLVPFVVHCIPTLDLNEVGMNVNFFVIYFLSKVEVIVVVWHRTTSLFSFCFWFSIFMTVCSLYIFVDLLGVIYNDLLLYINPYSLICEDCTCLECLNIVTDNLTIWWVLIMIYCCYLCHYFLELIIWTYFIIKNLPIHCFSPVSAFIQVRQQVVPY